MKLRLFCLCLLLFLSSFNQSNGSVTDGFAILTGTGKITGRIISPNGIKKDSVSLTITVSHPISGEYIQYKVPVDQSGAFSVDVDVETAVSLVGLYASVNPEKPIRVRGYSLISII